MKISYELPKYSLVSFVTFLTDYTIYIIAYQLSGSIPVSIFVARFFASLVQFWGNKIYVYRDKGGFLKQYLRFLLMITITGLISIALNNILINYIPYYFSKLVVEINIFIANYLLFKHIVFRVQKSIEE